MGGTGVFALFLQPTVTQLPSEKKSPLPGSPKVSFLSCRLRGQRARTLLSSPAASVGQGTALPPPQQQWRDGKSVCGAPGAPLILFWNTFTLERITPSWLSWEGGYLLLKSKTRNKNTTRRTIYLQPCSCQDSARLPLVAAFPGARVSREVWLSVGDCLFPLEAGAAPGERGDAPRLRSLSRCRAVEQR